jgi:primosomal protein N'
MYVVEVIPLAKSIRAESLSYFSTEHVSAGTLVTVPMRSREISGIVADVVAAKDVKAKLKQASYEMKEISSVGSQIFFKQFVVACRSFARFSGVTTGAVIKALTPAPIIKNNQDLPAISSDIFLPEITAPQAKVIQASQEKQIGYIESLLQRRFSQDESVFVCAPTNQQVERLVARLDTKATIIRLDSTVKKSRLLSRWREVVTTSRPIVVVGTAPYLCVPRADLGLIVVMDEVNDAYKMIGRPHLDKRLFARHLATSLKRNCVLSSSVLSTETLWQYRDGQLGQVFKPVFHYDDGPASEYIDMKSLPDIPTSGVKLFSPPVARQIRRVTTRGEKMLLFVARRGRRPFTVCNDCGETVTCQRCRYPLVLTETTDGERRYVCRTCGKEETSQRRCDNCSSWRLEALGVGIDFVADILAEKIPELTVFQIDGSSTANEARLQSTLEQFYASDGGVLLTTQLGINRLTEPVDSSAVITADSLLALPDLSVADRLFSLLIKIREQTKEHFFIQSRAEHSAIFEQAAAGDVTSFYRQQISERERLNYPPFSYLIKLSSSGKQTTVKKSMKKIKQLFADEKISMYPGNDGKSYSAHALLQIPTDRWVDDEILEKLRSLPLSITINLHPRSLL